jgi:hypothetical protein
MTGVRIRTYSDLVAAMRRAAVELGTTRLAIDHEAGLPAGYASKILCPRPMRRLNWPALVPTLDALGLVLVIAPDPEAIEALRGRYQRQRVHSQRELEALNV